MSLRIEKQSHSCQRNMASGAKKRNGAKLATAPGSWVFGGGCVLGDFWECEYGTKMFIGFLPEGEQMFSSMN